MLNNITLQGRLTSSPELRRTGSGIAVASFTLAVEDDFKDKDGNRKTIFVDCLAWRGLGEMVAKYFDKGSMAFVRGKLDIRSWTDKDGNKRRSAEVIAENVYFGEAKKSDSYTGSYSTPASANQSSSVPAQDFAPIEDNDALLPF